MYFQRLNGLKFMGSPNQKPRSRTFLNITDKLSTKPRSRTLDSLDSNLSSENKIVGSSMKATHPHEVVTKPRSKTITDVIDSDLNSKPKVILKSNNNNSNNSNENNNDDDNNNNNNNNEDSSNDGRRRSTFSNFRRQYDSPTIIINDGTEEVDANSNPLCGVTSPNGHQSKGKTLYRLYVHVRVWVSVLVWISVCLFVCGGGGRGECLFVSVCVCG